MRYFYLLFIFITCGCQFNSKEEILDNTPIVSKDSIKGPYNFMSIEFKRYNKDSIIDKDHNKDYSPRRDLFNYYAIERGDSIIIVNHCTNCLFTTNAFIINLKQGKYTTLLGETSCTYSINFNPIKQKLILDDSSYIVGDTIKGYIEYLGRYSADSLNRFYEEALIQGCFKTILRDSLYDYSEERLNRLKIIFSDTVEYRKKYPQGFNFN